MKNNLVKIIPVVRMLASKNSMQLATAISLPDGLKKSEVLYLEESQPEIVEKSFKQWFGSNSMPPDNVSIKNLGSIHLTEVQKPLKMLSGKICVITGAGQGFGAGIAEMLFEHGAEIVIVDIKTDIGKQMEAKLNSRKLNNRAIFIQTDVSDAQSVESMIEETVLRFGGVDILISNAGILHAGGLEEITPEIFKRMTDVNYTGFFNCAKYASEIMKIQTAYQPGYFCDILQINSKSGLKGSKSNFAYAGGKFGGIGLVQSFALELIKDNIKVNAICPGNFFDGPLWSDSERGLFVQYLKTGKVPGAKTIEDVRKFYENQIPAGRGCRVEDVVKAILYAIDQKYETGQAIPVTGGQIMLH